MLKSTESVTTQEEQGLGQIYNVIPFHKHMLIASCFAGWGGLDWQPNPIG